MVIPWEISGRKNERSHRWFRPSIWQHRSDSGHPLMERRSGIVRCVASSTSWSVDAVASTAIVTVIAAGNGGKGGRHGAVVESWASRASGAGGIGNVSGRMASSTRCQFPTLGRSELGQIVLEICWRCLLFRGFFFTFKIVSFGENI